MYQQYHEGWIEVICGCMFAGKSEELIRRIHVLSYAKKKIQVFKPRMDDRYAIDAVASHNGTRIPCHAVRDTNELASLVEKDSDVIAIDEVQFFDKAIVGLCERYANEGKRVMVAGLDLDFRGEPFGIMGELLAKSEFVTKLTAVCTCCGAPATRSQRLINGHPAAYDEKVVLVGAKECYEARCRHHHVVIQTSQKREG